MKKADIIFQFRLMAKRKVKLNNLLLLRVLIAVSAELGVSKTIRASPVDLS
jgi:hypothetical protein